MNSRPPAYASGLRMRAALVAVAVLTVSPAAAEDPPCMGSDLRTAKTGLSEAQIAIDRAIAATRSQVVTEQALLAKWLGVRSSADAEGVRNALVKMKAFSESVTFQCAVRTDIRLGDVYAFVNPQNSFVVVLGRFFFSAPDKGYSSKLGIIIHELSHFTLMGATKDPKIYGTKEALTLAAEKPADARRNAENIEYFIEALVFGK